MTKVVDVGLIPFQFETIDAAREAFRVVDARVTEHELVVSAFTCQLGGLALLVIGGPKTDDLLKTAEMVEQAGGTSATVEPLDLVPIAARIAEAHLEGRNGVWDHGEGMRL